MAATELDLGKHKRPAALTPGELADKLNHLRGVLEERGLDGVVLAAEGAMRWLTGLRHQIIDIAPGAESPVQALVLLRDGGFEITCATTRIEMPRVREQIPPVFKGQRTVRLRLAEVLPRLAAGVAAPGREGYDEVLGAIVRPLVGGLRGNQFKKLEWLSAMTGAVLAEVAHRLEPGMNGAEVRGLLFHLFARRGVESNLFLVALKGQEGHFHPLYDERYTVRKGCWVKLVAGARFADLIVSETAMVKMGGRVAAREKASYAALQEGAVAYAGCYREGRSEREIHDEVGRRFAPIGRKHGLPAFRAAAYFHHMGGPTSPVGNRDYILAADGHRTMFPWMQFAINPVETAALTKVELQGVVQPGGAPPLILDASAFTPPALQTYSEVEAEDGTRGKVADLIVR